MGSSSLVKFTLHDPHLIQAMSVTAVPVLGDPSPIAVIYMQLLGAQFCISLAGELNHNSLQR